MKRLLTILCLALVSFELHAATAFTEFFCAPAIGANINSGHTTNATATYTSVNGNWNGTDAFVPTDGSTPASTITNGAFASVYLDGATTAVYIGRVTNVVAGVNGTISVSGTAAAGSAPSSGATGRSIKVGGAWAGPTGASSFPFSLASLLRLTNSTPDRPRYNMKNNAEYTMSAQLLINSAGQYRIEGYATTPGDGGRAVISGNGVGASIALVGLTAGSVDMAHFIVRSNGTSTGSAGITVTGGFCTLQDIIASNIRGSGFAPQGIGDSLIECEAFSCGLNNGVLDGGFRTSSATTTLFERCISHDNTNANISGFAWNSSVIIKECIADTNGTNGYTWLPGATTTASLFNSDSYNNGGNGLELKGTAADSGALYVENCNFIKNSLFGISVVANNSNHVGMVWYCGMGSGTQANGSGTISASGFGAINVLTGTFITYAANATPWVDPANGDFRINLAAAYGTGRGTFVETAASYAGTVGYPSVGAAQPAGFTNSTSSVFAQ